MFGGWHSFSYVKGEKMFFFYFKLDICLTISLLRFLNETPRKL